LPFPFALISNSLKINSLAFKYSCKLLLIVIVLSFPSDAILEVVFTGSPIRENYGFWLPIIAAITFPILIPILNLTGIY